MATKRYRGDSVEYVISNKKMLGHLNAKGRKSFTYPLEDEARADRQIAYWEDELKRGILPEAFLDIEVIDKNLRDLIREYCQSVTITDEDTNQLYRILDEYGKTKLSEITFQWLEDFIAFKKRRDHLAPGTIRKYIGALNRCLRWAVNKEFMESNPCERLPMGYSRYSREDQKHQPAKFDVNRERRLSEDGKEEQRIRFVINGGILTENEIPIEAQHRAAFLFMFEMALETAMRLREMYTLTLDQIDLKRKTIFLDKTKNGHKRQVPMSSVLIEKYKAYRAHVKNGTGNMELFYHPENVFPWWNGDLDKRYLTSLTSKLSKKYGRIFNKAMCPGLNFHDLRHEATSRFFERTQLNELQIMKITGHSSTKMLARYANLRASDLADELW